MEESVAQDWPKTPGGSTDWEVVFEDPETGLIALIAQARSAEALRDCVVVVIKKLFTRETDPPEVERFIGELTQLIPDGTGDQNLTLVLEAVTGILRQIKDDRAKKAAEYEQFKEPAADGEKRGLEEARRKARLRKFFLIFGSGGVGIALSTGLLYLFIGGFLGGGSAEKDQ